MPVNSKNYYALFSLNIESAIACPQLPIGVDCPDIRIRYGKAPENLDNVLAKGVRYQASENQFLLIVDNIAKYLVENGTDVTIERNPGASDAKVNLFLLGSAMGALLHQRGILPLHGSAIEYKGEGIVFVAPSGYGKSTLAAAFCKRGYRVLADDIAAISFDDAEKPIVLPGSGALKLWQDSLEQLDHQVDSLPRVREELNKHYLPLNGDFCSQPVALQRIYQISHSNESTFNVEMSTGLKKANVLIDNTYRVRFLNGIGGKSAHFQQCAKIAQQTQIKTLNRPKHPFLLDELVDFLEEDLGK